MPVNVVWCENIDQKIPRQLQEHRDRGGAGGLFVVLGFIQPDDQSVDHKEENTDLSVAENEDLVIEAFCNNGILLEIRDTFGQVR